MRRWTWRWSRRTRWSSARRRRAPTGARCGWRSRPPAPRRCVRAPVCGSDSHLFGAPRRCAFSLGARALAPPLARSSLSVFVGTRLKRQARRLFGGPTLCAQAQPLGGAGGGAVPAAPGSVGSSGGVSGGGAAASLAAAAAAAGGAAALPSAAAVRFAGVTATELGGAGGANLATSYHWQGSNVVSASSPSIPRPRLPSLASSAWPEPTARRARVPAQSC